MKRLQVTDSRTPEELKADGDDRWPDGSEYQPPRCKGETCPKPHCPVCGECDQIQWVPCIECHGYGTIECICEGVGGEYVCGYGCDELAGGN